MRSAWLLPASSWDGARAALVKGWTLVLLGLWVLVACIWAIARGASPQLVTMGIVGTLALIANASIALILYRFREGDANMRSVWICSRNDAIGNLAVLGAAAGVFGTGRYWPDVVVALIMATLGISGGWKIISIANRELARTQGRVPADPYKGDQLMSGESPVSGTGTSGLERCGKPARSAPAGPGLSDQRPHSFAVRAAALRVGATPGSAQPLDERVQRSEGRSKVHNNERGKTRLARLRLRLPPAEPRRLKEVNCS